MPPKKDELIKVFSRHYPDGKLRYFKKIGGEQGSPIVVYADGSTSKTNNGCLEYWENYKRVE